MSLNKISIKAGGVAGAGVFTIGLLLSKYFQRANLNVVYTTDYPSLIKGGHNTCCVRAEDEEIHSEVLKHDVLIALDKRTIDEDLKDLNKGGVLICDSKVKFESEDYFVISLPFTELLGEMDKRYANTIAFGATIGVIGDDSSLLRESIEIHFKKKNKEVIDENFKAALVGYKYTYEICEKERKCYLGRIKKIETDNRKLFMSGNDAAALAAIKAGVKFVGEYPMTPSSSFLSFMAAHELDYNITTKHTEDELAAANMVIGAATAGVRAMTATSGGGFALMNEAVGFAGISETPMVIFECMRSGPSTGMPTYTDQGDLKFVINCSQGEFPIIVVAPGDLNECFYESFNAFNLAEITQTPVVVLLDKHVSASQVTVDRFDMKDLKIDRGKVIELNDKELKDYKRYGFSKDGVSDRCFPGQAGGIHVSSSYEHDETGWTSEDGKNHEMMMEKRFKKLDLIPKEFLKPKMYGPDDAELTLVGFGSTKGAVLDALRHLNKDGHKVNYMHFLYVNPFDVEEVTKMLNNCKDTMIVEADYTAQLRDIIREKTGYYIEKTYLKYDGRPFYFQDIYEKVQAVLGGKK